MSTPTVRSIAAALATALTRAAGTARESAPSTLSVSSVGSRPAGPGRPAGGERIPMKTTQSLRLSLLGAIALLTIGRR